MIRQGSADISRPGLGRNSSEPDGQVLVNGRMLRIIAIVMLALTTAGCGVLSNFDSMRASMEQMTYYAGMMASQVPYMTDNMRRMADTADRMDRKTSEISTNLEKRTASAEKILHGVTVDSAEFNRNMIQQLGGIRGELGNLSDSLKKTSNGSGPPPDQATLRALQAKLNDLEGRLSAITSKMEKPGKPQ